MRLLKKICKKVNWQSLIVSLAVVYVCIGTQQMHTVKWDTGLIDFSRDSLGVLMAAILFSHYKWSDFVRYKIPYMIWSFLGGIGGMIAVPVLLGRRAGFLAADTIVIALGVFFMGYCVIHTFISFFIEKYRPGFYRPLFGIWLVMLVLMIFSRSSYLWPECYFVLFLCYYMTPPTSAQRSNVIIGMVNGIILGFILIQAHSLLCRPYDMVRYKGNFCNPSHNCMFLCLCLAALLAKMLFVARAKRKMPIRILYFLLTGACYSFICMTASRSGFLAAFVVTVFFLIAYCRIREKKFFFRTGIAMVFLVIFMLPATYLAVRYIPTIHPHVLFYFQEGYSESRVHSWDAWDSPKYITFEQMLRSIFGRFAVTREDWNKLGGTDADASEKEILAVASAKKFFPLAMVLAVGEPASVEAETDPDKIPTLQAEDNAFIVRYTIYKWYFTHLSLRGMPYEEQGFQLTKSHWIQDTHNIYLDYGINFGYPVMILFAVFIWWGIGKLTRQGLRAKEAEKFACLFIALIPPVFGLFEFAWGAGMLSTVTLYLCMREMVVR